MYIYLKVPSFAINQSPSPKVARGSKLWLARACCVAKSIMAYLNRLAQSRSNSRETERGVDSSGGGGWWWAVTDPHPNLVHNLSPSDMSSTSSMSPPTPNGHHHNHLHHLSRLREVVVVVVVLVVGGGGVTYPHPSPIYNLSPSGWR